MRGDKIHILSTGEIPSFRTDLSTVVFDILPFQEIVFNNDTLVAERVNELTLQDCFAIFTSSNAVRAVSQLVGGGSPSWKCFCVGEKTAENLRLAFSQVEILAIADTASVLAKEIIAVRPSPLVFFSGNLRREELPAHLETHGLPLEELQVYSTTYMAPVLSRRYDGIMFFSPGAVNAYFETNQPDSNTVMFAIGPTTEIALREKTTNRILTTDRPDKAALAKTALHYFEENLT